MVINFIRLQFLHEKESRENKSKFLEYLFNFAFEKPKRLQNIRNNYKIRNKRTHKRAHKIFLSFSVSIMFDVITPSFDFSVE